MCSSKSRILDEKVDVEYINKMSRMHNALEH